MTTCQAQTQFDDVHSCTLEEGHAGWHLCPVTTPNGDLQLNWPELVPPPLEVPVEEEMQITQILFDPS